ncbi:hypothetical protein J7T55_013494 [Diaporthe amygdali]|uniref:uncharacterized protein n=1 Tax=Phomopsis amygdali TaxID=1214568 RepID=UPI0022FDE800|nr:uncharacterized protein J7T55_013494 [Diaporthe amygdali]KAJ0119257.1 hypothetical protein J7T55_013494 [Diaporthe amygdali]
MSLRSHTAINVKAVLKCYLQVSAIEFAMVSSDLCRLTMFVARFLHSHGFEEQFELATENVQPSTQFSVALLWVKKKIGQMEWISNAKTKISTILFLISSSIHLAS